MAPFVVIGDRIVEDGVTTMRVIPALDELVHRLARLGLSAEVAAVERLAFERSEKLSHIALSKQSPTEPIEGRTPESRQRIPKAIDVYSVPWSE
jgi:hypothetical protein